MSNRSAICALFLLLFTAGLSLPAVAGNTPADRERFKSLMLEGLAKAYDFRFASADSIFTRVSAIEPLHPRPYLGKASMRFWVYLLSKDEKSRDEFLTYADRTIGAAEAYIDTYGEESDILVCLGTIYGYRSFAEARSKNYLTSAWDGKKSYDYFEKAVERDPANYDAYIGLGVYHYFSAFLPKTLQWIVSILGVTSDSDLGVRQVRMAAEKGTYSRVEAAYYLAQFLPWSEGDFTSSESIYEDLLRRYPRNSVFSFSLAVWQMRRNDIAAARKVLQGIVNNPEPAIPGAVTFATYKLAECYYRLEDFARAREAYHAFLLNYTDDPYVATTLYRLGICYEMEGNYREATKYYSRAQESPRGTGDDAYCRRKAQFRLSGQMTRVDTLLLHAQNRLRTGDYTAAKNTFLELLSLPGLPADISAEARYGLGETLIELGAYEEAITNFTATLRTKVVTELWLYPWSYFQRGTCYNKLGRRQEALEEFTKVGDFEDYDFENWLSFRTSRELDRLNPH